MSPVSCPQCSRPAQITDRFTLGSTSGPLEHVKTRCPEGHRFTVLEEDLQAYRPPHAYGQRRAAAAVPVLAARLGLL
jgi:hypothetical protein